VRHYLEKEKGGNFLPPLLDFLQTGTNVINAIIIIIFMAIAVTIVIKTSLFVMLIYKRKI